MRRPEPLRARVHVVATFALVVACGDARTAGFAPAPRPRPHVDDAGAGGASPSLDASVEAPDAQWDRTYEGACAAQQIPSWTTFTWKATTPGDSRIELFARAADTEALVVSAPRVHLATALNQSNNSAFVELGDPLGEGRAKRWLRIEGDLYAGSDGQKPEMGPVSVSFDCLPAP